MVADMKALILASGTGRRLRPLTDHVPKSLIKIGDKTILDYQMESLTGHGVSKIIITTGPFEEKLISHVQGNYPAEVTFVNNPRYEVTNYIYTLWLTKSLVDEDVILLHGDLLFDSILIGKLIEAEGNRALVNKRIKPPKKDFKALIKNNRVVKIGVEFSGPDAYFCAPMYKFSMGDFLHWVGEIEKFIEKGHTSCYAEDAFNEISGEIVLRPLFFDEFCIEIDTVSDLKKAQNWMRSKAGKQ